MKRIFSTKLWLRNVNAALYVGLGLTTLCDVATLLPQSASAQEVEKDAPERSEAPKISPEDAAKIRKEIDELSALQYQAMNNHEYETAIRAGERTYALIVRLEEANAHWRDVYVKRVANGVGEKVEDEGKNAPGVKRVRMTVGPSKTFLFRELGSAYGFLGDWEKAEEYYRRAGLYEPKNAKVFFNATPRAQVAFGRGRFDEAFDVVCASTNEALERIAKIEDNESEKAREIKSVVDKRLWSQLAQIAKPINFRKPVPLSVDVRGLTSEGSRKEATEKWKARCDEITKTFPETADECSAIYRANFDELMEKVVEPEFKRRGEPEEFRAAVELLRELATKQTELADAYFKSLGGETL